MNKTQTSYFHIPDRLPTFINRKAELTEGERLLLRKPVPALLIWGEAGVGKTSLAREFVNLLAGKNIYHSIIWTTAKTHELEVIDEPTKQSKKILPRRGTVKKVSHKSVRSKNWVLVESMQDLLQTILLYSGYEDFHSSQVLEEIWDDEDLLKKEVVTWMQEKKILLIIDDIDGWSSWRDLFNFLEYIYSPSGVIITSRQFLERSIKGLGDLFVSRLPTDEQAKILEKLIDTQKLQIGLEERKNIVEYSEGNPLILNLLVGLIALRSRGFTNISRKVSKAILDETYTAIRDNKNIQSFLFKNIYDRLEGIAPKVLQTVAVTKTKTNDVKPEAIKHILNIDSLELNLALDELSSSSLLSYDYKNPESISIHPLVQDFVLNENKREINKIQKLVSQQLIADER
jgi:hypothetical protein